MNQLTELLGRLQAGDPEARDALFAASYRELHRLARSRLRDGGRDAVLDTTCLVHEAYLRFVSAGELRAEDRRAFFAYASWRRCATLADIASRRLLKRWTLPNARCDATGRRRGCCLRRYCAERLAVRVQSIQHQRPR